MKFTISCFEGKKLSWFFEQESTHIYFSGCIVKNDHGMLEAKIEMNT